MPLRIDQAHVSRILHNTSSMQATTCRGEHSITQPASCPQQITVTRLVKTSMCATPS